MKVLLSLILLLSTLTLHAADLQEGHSPAEKGVLDLRNESLVSRRIVRLDGQWEFFREQFPDREAMPSYGLSGPDYTEVPGSWHFDTDYPPHGYGTFRLRIEGLDDNLLYALYVPDMISSYRLYINGEDKGGNGKPGISPDFSVPQFLPRTVSFYPSEGQAEILLKISNFSYRKSGIWRSIYIGREEGISFFRLMRIIPEVAIASILFSIAVFHIGIYLSRNQEKAEFLFGLICLTFVVRILCTGEQLLTFFIPSLPWEIIRKLEYIPFYGSAPLLVLFMSALFPGETSRTFSTILLAAFSLFGLLVLLLPVSISNHLIPLAETFILIGLIYAVWILIRASVRKRREAPLLSWAYLIFSLAVINDIFYASQIVQTMYMSPLGFVIFMIMQSQMLIMRYSRSFTQREQLVLSRDKFLKASITDSLTGLFNVRYLHRALDEEIILSRSKAVPLTLIMADVDNFKHYNDTWGHKQGDEVLKLMGKIIRGSAREGDIPCRYGGEEFSLILPETNLLEAMDVAERFRSRFEQGEYRDERMQGITVSIGVALLKDSDTADSLIDRADKAMYSAKKQGKNRVVMAGRL